MTALAEHTASAATRPTPRCTFVKWRTPADEMVGLASLAAKAIESGEVEPRRLAFAVPNRNWGAQLERACGQIGLRTTFCATAAHLDRAAALALAKLRLIAEPGSAQARARLIDADYDEAAIDHLVAQCTRVSGFTLAHRLGIDAERALAHGMLHVAGTESATELLNVLSAQLARPTVPRDRQLSPIMDYRALTGAFDWVVVAGCAEGLIPDTRALANTDEGHTALERQRAAFVRARGCARVRTVLSSFAKADADLAKAARLRIARTKTEQGRRICLCTPTRFIDEMGAHRPSTVGGQALLREYGIN